jgi:ParB family chromosome partitioning protein
VPAKQTARKSTTRRKRAQPGSRGLAPDEVATETPPPELEALARRIREAGGELLARYRDPLGGHWLALAALPLARVAPTPFQRDLSNAHVKRLAEMIDRVGRFLDPVIAVPAPDDAGEVAFWTPNGLHRWSALQQLGARTIVALISPEPALAYRILALNTEKAHNTRERALEAMRMARGLAEVDPSRPESEFALELEDGSLVTLGLAYEAAPRFAGGAYAPALRASDAFLDAPLAEALSARQARAERLLAIDARVAEIMASLRARGFDSPYLRNFVVARIRPFRTRGKPAPGADELLDQMEAAAAKFDAGKVREDQVSRAAGGPGED